MRRTRAAKTKSQTPEEVGESGTKTGSVWQWMGDDGQWAAYSPADSASLDSAVSAGRASATLTLGSGAQYKVDLKKMVQTNPVTKYKRKIRCETVKSENEDEAASSTSSTSVASTSAQVKKEEETEGEEPAVKKRKQKKESPTENDDVRTVVMKGKAPVDPECKVKLGKAYVYSEGEDVYDVMLNQTNLQYNNNKFYLIQLLQDNNSKVYSVWMRWGRVGKVGQNSLKECGGDLLKAKNIFKEKFFDKTNNDWDGREFFEKDEGKYDMLFVDYCKTEQKKATVARTTQKSQLHDKVQSLLKLICDLEAMEECVLEMKFDTQKAPLGKLTTEQIRAGYAALRRIEACLKSKSKSNQKELLAACNQFYTRIPHNFGLKTPPMIHSEEELKQKIALLEALSDIQIAVKMLQAPQESDEDPLDRQYRFLHCKLEPLDSSGDEFKRIEKYLQSTHASTHHDYTMDILSVFSVDREGETDKFTSSLHNKRLLWHGSRMSNWVGILNQGLRVAPPEAPVTGYMFGKGIYFADMSSKSANYCFARQHNDVGLLLLCEVALGDSQELLDANCEASKLPAGKHSVKGLGQTGPDPANSLTLDEVTMPMGPGVKTAVDKPRGYSLLYNEFIVYDPAQVRMRYLLQIKFNFSSLW